MKRILTECKIFRSFALFFCCAVIATYARVNDDPFLNSPLKIQVNNTSTYITSSNSYEYVPTCDQAYRQNTTTNVATTGTSFAVPNYLGAIYKWTFPKGWRINSYNNPTLPTPVVNSDESLTYTGTFAQLGYIRATSSTPSEKRGETIIDGGQVKVEVSVGVNYQSLIFNIKPHAALDVQLPGDVITCKNEINLLPILKLDVNHPIYTINWTTTGGSLAFASTSTNYNYFSAANGTYKIRATIADDRCVSDHTQTTITLGSPTVSNGTWNSGILSDNRSMEVNSNIQHTVQGNRVWVVANEKGSTDQGIYYYSYNSAQGWTIGAPLLDPKLYLGQVSPAVVAKPANRVKPGPNSLLMIPSSVGSSVSPAYYIGVNAAGQGGSVRYIQSTNAPFDITLGNTHNDVLELFDLVVDFPHTHSDAYYRRSNGYLGYYEGQSGTSNEFLNEVTKFDVTISNGEVFYIDNAGALFSKPVATGNNGTKTPVAPAGTFAPYTGNTTGYTDLVCDSLGNVYYVRQGQLYMRSKVDNYAVEKATFTSTVALSGNFTMNKSSKTFYCVGIDRSIYQIFKTIVNSTVVWAGKKASVSSLSTSDLGGTYPVFAGSHLFYISKTTSSAPRQDWAAKTVFNLYFIDGCTPSPLRKSLDEEDVMNKEAAEYETTLQASVYPNPFTNEITFEMEGNGNAEIKLYNAVGKVVKTIPYAFGQINIDTEHLKEGLYTLTVYQNGKRLIAKKIVK